MELKILLAVLLKIFKLRLASTLRPVPQDAVGTVTFVCKSNQRPGQALSQSQVTQALASANYGSGVTVEDLDVRVTPLKLALNEKAYYVSAFIALNVGDSITGFNVAYSTQGRCLHITKVE